MMTIFIAIVFFVALYLSFNFAAHLVEFAVRAAIQNKANMDVIVYAGPALAWAVFYYLVS